MEKIYPKLIQSDKKELVDFLNSQGLTFEDNIESSFVIRVNNKIIATGSRYKNILKCLAIDDTYKGGDLINQLLSELINEIYAEGYDNIFVYTKASYEETFSRFGFKTIEGVNNKLIFMERSDGFSSYLNFLKGKKVDSNNIGSIVMNANPFTLGHKYLVDYASKHCDFIYLFLVSEDLSDFSTEERYKLVKEGCKDIKNMEILPTRNYIISAATFPSYFIKKEDDLTEIQARLDAAIFKNSIAKVLSIDKRFVGEEKNDQVTAIYNRVMKEVLKKGPKPIELIEIPRKTIDGEAISASKVRKLIKDNDFDKLSSYLPKSSLDYINKKYKSK